MRIRRAAAVGRRVADAVGVTIDLHRQRRHRSLVKHVVQHSERLRREGGLAVAPCEAFAGLLGAIGALLFRQNSIDQTRADNTNKALDTVQSALASTPPNDGPSGTPADPVNVKDAGR